MERDEVREKGIKGSGKERNREGGRWGEGRGREGAMEVGEKRVIENSKNETWSLGERKTKGEKGGGREGGRERKEVRESCE